MATGGPYVDKNALLTADDALGAPVETTTTGAAPAVPALADPADQTGGNGGGLNLNLGKLNVDVQQPEWAYRPTQQDFGQVDVRRGNYSTGMVPTVNVQMPFPALANRQQAQAERKAALAKKLQDFDLYSGIGKAADPYQRNFGKLARADMDQMVTDVANGMFGGDRTKATEYFLNDPQGRAMHKARAANWNDVGVQSQDKLKRGVDDLLREENGERVFVDPRAKAITQQMVNATGQFGGPEGGDVMSQAKLYQDYDQVMSSNKYIKEFVLPSVKEKMQTMKEFSGITRDPKSGAFLMTETEKRNFDGMIREHAKEMANMGIGTESEMTEILTGNFPPSVIVETEMKFKPAGKSSKSGSGEKQTLMDRALTPVMSELPTGALGRKKTVKTTDKYGTVTEEQVDVPGTPTGQKFPTLDLFDIRSNQGVFPSAREFKTGGVVGIKDGKIVSDDKKSTSKTIHPTRIMDVGGKLFIIGRETSQPRTSGMKTGSDDEEEVTDIQEFSKLPEVIVPYEGNENLLVTSFPWLKSDENVRQALRKASPSFATDGGAPAAAPKRLKYNPATGRAE